MPTDYRELAGMSSNKDKWDKVGSKKSVGSNKSKRSEKGSVKTDEVQELDRRLDDLDEQIQSNLAFVAETYEKAQRQYSTVFETDEPMDDNISVEDAQKLKELQTKELETMDRRLLQLEEWQACMDLREQLMEHRRKIEMVLWRQRIQEREHMLKGQEEMLVLRQKEGELNEKREMMAQRFEKFDKKQPPRDKMDSMDKTRRWLHGAEAGSGHREEGHEPRQHEVRVQPDKGAKDRVMEKQRVQPESSRQSKTSSQCKIAELEEELRRVREEVRGRRTCEPQLHEQLHGMQAA